MSICDLDPEMPTTPAEKNVLKHPHPNASSDELSLFTAPLTPQSPPSVESLPSAESSPAAESSPSVESREDQSQRGSSWNRGYNQNRRRYNNNRPKPRKFGPRNTEMRPYHSPNHVSPPHDRPMTKNDIYFALDCEMVGVGPEGLESAVARVTLCNWAEEVILDTFVKVPVEVTDYRTFVSGIEAEDLEGDKALPLNEVRDLVQRTLHGKILIGHALENDLTALQITHPWHDTRDSANYPPFMQEVPDLGDSSKSNLRPRKLKELVKDKLGQDIQDLGKSHDPIEDALSALRLYKTERLQWEQYVVQKVAAAKVQQSGPYVRDAMTSSPLPYNHQGSPKNMNGNMNMGMHSPQNHRYQSGNFQQRNRSYSANHHRQGRGYGGDPGYGNGYNNQWVRHRSF